MKYEESRMYANSETSDPVKKKKKKEKRKKTAQTKGY